MQMMMTLYELTKKYGEGKGEAMMWSTLHTVSEAIEESMEVGARERLMRHLFGQMSKGHYDRDYALADVGKMYYKDDAGIKHNAPYWTESQIHDVYEKVKKDIPAPYNEWDFYVVLQMMKSDNCSMLRKWFPNATQEEIDSKIVDLAINWLNDTDNPYGDHKIWGYMSAK